VWLLFALIFFYNGISSGGYTINYDLAPTISEGCIDDLATCLYFSAVTMTTLGYGDYAPASSGSKFFAGAQAVVGMVLVAMFLVAMQRRYVGR
jgi:hypothetical protein